MEKLLKLKDAAEILNVHPNTLRLWDKKGMLVAVRIGEKKSGDITWKILKNS